MRVLILLALLLPCAAFGQGSALLTCTPPTTNTDGSPLTDLAGYKVYRGSSSTSFTNSVTLQGGSPCSYRWDNLPNGTHYFVVTAINTASVESAFSNVASKTIGAPVGPVTVAGPVFNLGITTNSMVLLEAGSVIAGRPCDGAQRITFGGKTYTRVDAALVTPFPGQQILAAWATCQ